MKFSASEFQSEMQRMKALKPACGIVVSNSDREEQDE